ncbi:MAG: response regulator [Deltaproteobacteria bacterium]|nr:response regulator [Deltaproteobacteria bacterium]
MDDEAQFRSTLAKRLQKRGVVALQAGSGEECLSILEDHPMDVVVLDVKMPGISGIDALSQITERHAETEVILLTGHAATQDGVEGIKSGAYDYLTKPVEFDHLLGKIIQAYEKILGEKQQKEAAEYRARTKQQMIATERLAALGTLAAGIAHEINNPLAIINESAGYLESLLQKQEYADMPRRAVFEKALKKIGGSVGRARNITHQLLGNVRKTKPILTDVDAFELVLETAQLIKKEAQEKEIVVDLQTAEALKPILTNPSQVRQVLINLISNAIHATPQQGRISVEVAPTAGGISIAVSDTGTGVPKEHLEKIFEPFFSTKAPGEGTGLGLFVTREIVEKLGGTVEVMSKIGQDTRFTVYIPDQGRAENMGNR